MAGEPNLASPCRGGVLVSPKWRNRRLGLRRRKIHHAFSAARGRVAPHARAQQPATPVIGYLSPSTLTATRTICARFARASKRVAMSRARRHDRLSFGENEPNRCRAGRDLVRRRVNVIAREQPRPRRLVAAKATTTIPIVSWFSGRPSGLVLSRAFRGRAAI